MATKVITMCDVCETTDGEVMPVKVVVNGTVYIADLCETHQDELVSEPLAKFYEVANANGAPVGGATRLPNTPISGVGSPSDVRAYFQHIGAPIAPKGRVGAEDRTKYDKAVAAGEWPAKP